MLKIGNNRTMGGLETCWYISSETKSLIVGNSGRIGALMEYKIIDPDGNELPPGQPGELCLKGPNIMLGKFCLSSDES